MGKNKSSSQTDRQANDQQMYIVTTHNIYSSLNISSPSRKKKMFSPYILIKLECMFVCLYVCTF